MDFFRINNDISITWKITRVGKPENFEGKDISVKLISQGGIEQTIAVSLDKPTATFTIDFLGKDQNETGVYTLLLVENGGKVNMSTLDELRVFGLVAVSEMESIHTSCKSGVSDCCYNVCVESDFSIGHVINVIDNLLSNSGKDALSANQGRILNDKITKINEDISAKFVKDEEQDTLIQQNTEKVQQAGQKNTEQDTAIANILTILEKAGQHEETQNAEIKRLTLELANCVKKVAGYGLSQEDFTSILKAKLESLENYNDYEVNARIDKVIADLDAIMDGSVSGAIDTIKEIESFLEGFTDKQTLVAILKQMRDDIEAQIPHVDTQIMESSKNPVENQAVSKALKEKQNKTDPDIKCNDKTVVGAINELHDKKQNETDNLLLTFSKSIVPAINEIFAGLKSVATDKQNKNDDGLETADKTIVGAINELFRANSNQDNLINGKFDKADISQVLDDGPGSQNKVLSLKIATQELKKKQNANDDTLQTTDKTIVGAINETSALAKSTQESIGNINSILDTINGEVI